MSVTPNTYANILKYGIQSAYDALATKDSNVLYFCTDTKKIYKGTVDFTDSVIFAATKPTTGIVSGKMYVFADTGTCEVYNAAKVGDNKWEVVSYPVVTTIADDPAGNDDVHVPTAKAVYDFVEAEIEELVTGEDVVKTIVQKTTTDQGQTVPVRGTFTYTTGDDVDHDVQLTGVVTKPSYDPTTRTFTFPVAGENDVEVELGTDIFIDPTANNRYENGCIYLYLNDGNQQQSGQDTEIVIPVTSLVTDYFGDDTDSIQVDVDNSTHKVTAQAILKPDITTAGSEWTNALKVSSASGAKGLYVDLTPVETDIETLDTNMGLLATAVGWGTF